MAGTFGSRGVSARLGGGQYGVIGSFNYTGEKNLGEMGPIRNYKLDYEALRSRSWQLFLESDLAQALIKKRNTWMIGRGLKLQSEPIREILEYNSAAVELEFFTKLVEARWKLFSKSKRTDYAAQKSLNRIAKTAAKQAEVGGDVLVILRYIRKQITIQLIDGVHVSSPLGRGVENNPLLEAAEDRRIENGIEMDAQNRHIAYWVRKAGVIMEWERIPAFGKETGIRQAYMVYGPDAEYRIDNNRGLPLLAVVMETVKKLERYKEATVGSAEERQKLAYFFEHQQGSMGDFPLAKQTALAIDYGKQGDVPKTDDGQALADKVTATTNKQTWNLPPGVTAKELTSKNELQFKDFFEANFGATCYALEIPPEVARSMYNSNYSASKAAINDWMLIIGIKRDDFAEQFYQPIYNFAMLTWSLEGKISAPGYLEALSDGNADLVEAYCNCRWVGPQAAHIDPLKEVKAEREKLGAAGLAVPLTTVEQATENLNGGDSESNMTQFSDELKRANTLGIKASEKTPTKAAPSGNSK